MTKAEKNYRRDYGHKSNEELALNYGRDSLKEELDNVLETVNPDDLSESEKAYLNGRNQRKNHTLNIRFNDTEWEQICRQAELLKMKKSNYVRECSKARLNTLFTEEFLNKCADFDILVEYNPDHKIDLKFMLTKQKECNLKAKFSCSRTLDWFYETSQIKQRIAQHQGIITYVPRMKNRQVEYVYSLNRFGK